MTQSRPLSLHERFSLARRNAGQPPILTIAAVYSAAASAPTLDFLSQRIAEIQAHFPQLYALIQDARSASPSQVLRDGPWESSAVLRTGVYSEEKNRDKELAGVLLLDGKRMLGEDVERAPLWQITVYTSPSKPRVYVSLSVDHVLLDGRGVAILLQAILAKHIAGLPYEQLETTPRVEDTVDMKPTLAFALPLIWHHLILPRLPLFLQRSLTPAKAWPADLISATPLTSPSAFSLFTLSLNEVSQLKTIAKAHGVPTLNPVINAIYALAIWSKYRYTLSPFRLVAISARSERDNSLGHPHALGNYVSSHKIEVDIKPGSDFWAVARTISDQLSSQESISHARMRMGMLSQIPGGLYTSPTGIPDPLRPTLFEDFLLKGAESATPLDTALAFSNLGFVHLPEGAEDMAWAQAADGLGNSVFSTNVIGHEGGVKVGTNFSEGAAVRTDEVEGVKELFKGIVHKLIEGKSNVNDLG
ncbi:hypothetical protein L202_02263 [Cryptococcus amylolentus CBS 6039]|uniref:Diacylglycerol O-acyltransferase n=2 Tax=Cryptococcus amylolentus TaxID=104669 RepID=A0A1E3I002_9TREE|nr:hypothetical protein L202_02263 [Cryptococcus amylolentus CBS 6039]ODN81919.1 hypothetical protein L202_02263 [Cryptococcus amylolentus CBS 6039]ODO09929.1 hypothetical protein I350_02152 [Cryptococcus amylolentus CBS 6273]